MEENKLIECHCFLIKQNLQDIGIPQEGDKARVAFYSSSVEAIREVMDDDGWINPDECKVYFKNGDAFAIDMSYEKAFETVFNQKPK